MLFVLDNESQFECHVLCFSRANIMFNFYGFKLGVHTGRVDDFSLFDSLSPFCSFIKLNFIVLFPFVIKFNLLCLLLLYSDWVMISSSVVYSILSFPID